MHLKSLSLKGFKSFPDRTRLEFGPGVSVVVGPNGSGKSNITDAVLWAMGEQSPIAVRGQSMQDVIFGGGRGQQARAFAEVEIVIEADDSELETPELSIVRRLDRAGEGEYRLNGARCRLVDVIEALSDTGLGKESHSVVSQGRVEAIVTSKPRDRRLLIEEAAGLGKHRKRRRRAQLKLDRTQVNLDRALDVEREARSRLRPLKRQAEAAELHERLERQTFEAGWTLAREQARERGVAQAQAEREAGAERARRDAADRELGTVAARREQAEQALAQRSEQREALAGRAYAARSAGERVGYRAERARERAEDLRRHAARAEQELAELRELIDAEPEREERPGRIAELEAELERLERDRAAELERELEELRGREAAAAAQVERCDAGVAERREAVQATHERAEAARAAAREADRAVEAARRETARVGAELAAVNQFLRSHAGAPGGAPGLADALEVEPGCELALAAALDGRLVAAIADSRAAAGALLDRAGDDGGSVIVRAQRAAPAPSAAGPSGAATSPAGLSGADPTAARSPSGPVPPAARRLLDLVRGPSDVLALAAPLLRDVWLVEDLGSLPEGFGGIAVTPAGRVWFEARRELRQVPAGGADRVLAQRNERRALIAATERVASAEVAAVSGTRAAAEAVSEADAARDASERALRDAQRERDAAAEARRRAAWLIDERRSAPDEGTGAVRRAQIESELQAERRLADRLAAERAERARRLELAQAALRRDQALAPAAERLAAALAGVQEAIAERVRSFDNELRDDREAGERLAADLRACAQQEAELQTRLRGCAEAVTAAEVRAQQARDHLAAAQRELSELAGRLELEATAADEPLGDEERVALEERVARLARRRELLGPVNPLAKDEYAEAVAHVEGLEHQREDLETAIRELNGLIAETDRQIRETFEETFTAAARGFEELVGHLFPGGRGRLRLVREDAGPRPVLGGQALPDGDEQGPSAEDHAEAAEAAGAPEDDLLGVEIELTPAGKSTKRLSLLSGGEKSLTALAFLFAVFLARPCPFYILDEVEAALDDLNIDRFLTLLRRYSDRAQFIVVTHQKRTMEAADTLYGVSMGDDGVSKVISRRLPREESAAA
jgi:chromosome segregation protein